jgi:AcrR family transcriptional regulator
MATKTSRDGSVASRLDQRRRSANEASNESYTAKQREIVEAAGRLFAERGYDATNFDDIAKSLGMDRATLYYYFKSKTHLLGSAVTDVLSGAVRELKTIVVNDDDAWLKLRASIRCILTTMAETHPFSALYYQDHIWRSPRNAPWIESLRKDDARIRKVFERIIEDGQHDGTIRDDIPAKLINRILIGSLASAYRWFGPEGDRSVEEVVHAFDAILSAGVAPQNRKAQRTQQRKPASTARRASRSQSADSSAPKSPRRR